MQEGRMKFSLALHLKMQKISHLAAVFELAHGVNSGSLLNLATNEIT